MLILWAKFVVKVKKNLIDLEQFIRLNKVMIFGPLWTIYMRHMWKYAHRSRCLLGNKLKQTGGCQNSRVNHTDPRLWMHLNIFKIQAFQRTKIYIRSRFLFEGFTRLSYSQNWYKFVVCLWSSKGNSWTNLNKTCPPRFLYYSCVSPYIQLCTKKTFVSK